MLNKVDVLSEMDRERAARRFADAVAISALTGEGTEALLERVALELPRPPVEVTLLVPYGRDDVVALLYRDAEVLDTEAECRRDPRPGSGGGPGARGRRGLRRPDAAPPGLGSLSRLCPTGDPIPHSPASPQAPVMTRSGSCPRASANRRASI